MEALPPSCVLDRLQAFLPALEKANADLSAQAPDAVSLELQGEVYLHFHEQDT